MAMPPLLSVVTPTRGDFSDYWLTSLLQIRGEVQFVIVYPPATQPMAVADSRVKCLVSPYKGEMMQRFVGFLNADGRYVIALDDDDYLHPEVLSLTSQYFQRFPESWVLRLSQARIPATDQAAMTAPWEPIPAVAELPVEPDQPDASFILRTVPIAPLTIPFDWRYLIWPWLPRRDDQGRHIENFNTKVWDHTKVRQVLPALAHATQLLDNLTWIPKSGFDRLMGLFLQAYFFEAGATIGHWMPPPGQVRFITQDPKLKPPRYHAASDFLLVRAFPQYGYFWNLFFNKLSYIPRITAKRWWSRYKS